MVSFTIAEKKGKFLKPCPGTPKYVCCGYWIIDFAHGCSLGCSYCILNYYFGKEKLILYRNTEKLFQELEEFLKKRKGITRFGTGEFTDSLLFEDEYPVYHELIPFIAERNNAVLEVKTKTTNIDRLLKIDKHNNAIISWSLNSDFIVASEEPQTPDIKRRILSASRVQEAGYRLAFHFDPIIIHEGWEDAYRKTIDLLFEKIDPDRVVYISMGTLRFPPQIKRHIPNISTGEFIKGMDKKLRYFRPQRTVVYKKIQGFLLRYVNEDLIYLCMESQDVWEDVFNIKMDSDKLKQRLDRACLRKFNLVRKEDRSSV